MDALRPDVGIILFGLIIVCVYLNRLTKALSLDHAKLHSVLEEIRDALLQNAKQ
jgi:hypothetical protein